MAISFGNLTKYRIFVNGYEKKSYNKDSKNEINGIARLFAETMSNPKKCDTPELKKARAIFSEHVGDYFIPENETANNSNQIKNFPLVGNERYLISTKKDIDKIENLRKNTMGLDMGCHCMTRKDALEDFEAKLKGKIRTGEIDVTKETLNIYVDKNYNGKTYADKYKITGIGFQA